MYMMQKGEKIWIEHQERAEKEAEDNEEMVMEINDLSEQELARLMDLN